MVELQSSFIFQGKSTCYLPSNCANSELRESGLFLVPGNLRLEFLFSKLICFCVPLLSGSFGRHGFFGWSIEQWWSLVRYLCLKKGEFKKNCSFFMLGLGFLCVRERVGGALVVVGLGSMNPGSLSTFQLKFDVPVLTCRCWNLESGNWSFWWYLWLTLFMWKSLILYKLDNP